MLAITDTRLHLSSAGEDDHEEVKTALLDVAHRWTHIGGAFRLRRAKLKSLPGVDAEECLAEVPMCTIMLLTWYLQTAQCYKNGAFISTQGYFYAKLITY